MEATYELYKAAEITHNLPTKQDIIEIESEVGLPEHTDDKWGDIQWVVKQMKQDMDEGNAYIPVNKTIHAFPDMATYDPEDYYEVDKYNKGIEDDLTERLNYDRGI